MKTGKKYLIKQNEKQIKATQQRILHSDIFHRSFEYIVLKTIYV